MAVDHKKETMIDSWTNAGNCSLPVRSPEHVGLKVPPLGPKVLSLMCPRICITIGEVMLCLCKHEYRPQKQTHMTDWSWCKGSFTVKVLRAKPRGSSGRRNTIKQEWAGRHEQASEMDDLQEK